MLFFALIHPVNLYLFLKLRSHVTSRNTLLKELLPFTFVPWTHSHRYKCHSYSSLITPWTVNYQSWGPCLVVFVSSGTGSQSPSTSVFGHPESFVTLLRTHQIFNNCSLKWNQNENWEFTLPRCGLTTSLLDITQFGISVLTPAGEISQWAPPVAE